MFLTSHGKLAGQFGNAFGFEVPQLSATGNTSVFRSSSGEQHVAVHEECRCVISTWSEAGARKQLNCSRFRIEYLGARNVLTAGAHTTNNNHSTVGKHCRRVPGTRLVKTGNGASRFFGSRLFDSESRS